MSRVTGSRHHSGAASLTVRFRYLLFFSFVFAGSYLILTTNKYSYLIINARNMSYVVKEEESDMLWESHYYNVTDERNYTIHTTGCSIPAMNPLDESIEKIVKYPSQQQPCPNSSLSLVSYNKEEIWINKHLYGHYNTTEDNLSCCYQAFYRPVEITDITSRNVDNRAGYDKCTYFKDKIQVNDEFVKVTCKNKKKVIFRQFYAFTPKKIFIKRDNIDEISKNKLAYNVLVLGIDAVSRLNFHRTMPKTLSYIQKKGAIELLGYNKVGDNTYPNVIPMLLGINVEEIKRVCLPHRKSTFDNCPFVWEWFKQSGYYTALGEDCSAIGTFTYGKSGFVNTPTDYYLHTFISEAETTVGNNKDFNSFLCMNDRYFYKVLLDYVEDLTTTLRQSKLFGFFWEATMSHDYLNYPMVMDDDYTSFFMRLDESGYLNDTVIFLLSDHGIRWGPIRSTQQGCLEERLPFVYILTPPSFKDKFNKAYVNLKRNSKYLTTPFDIHATLNDLTDLKNLEDSAIDRRNSKDIESNRSISLFLEIPSSRTCKMAGIDDHWCTCHKQELLSKDSSEAMEAAANLVMFVNKMLETYSQCAHLSILKVLHATELKATNSIIAQGGRREILVVVKTVPGNAIFEATLRRESSGWALAGTVSRLNLYGEQSHCVNNYEMKLYCYCK